MLNLIQTEFLKLRRNKLIWLMLLAALIMPFFALFFVDKGVDPRKYYRWSALGFTLIIILPVILGILSTMLMHEENQYDMLKQLWIVPISKMGYFFSKFFIVLVYSICFMLITFVASVMVSVLSGYLVFEWENVFYLLKNV
ncbi:ABC transporter permease [Paraclostridium sp. AKS73]|uniref:ABC transporter permease n=1 Tax=Paraclostridium sp. AKS73 TaxID=2876116 RepID=UPI002FCD5774